MILLTRTSRKANEIHFQRRYP